MRAITPTPAALSTAEILARDHWSALKLCPTQDASAYTLAKATAAFPPMDMFWKLSAQLAPSVEPLARANESAATGLSGRNAPQLTAARHAGAYGAVAPAAGVEMPLKTAPAGVMWCSGTI